MKISRLISSSFGLGLLPYAPGTWGTFGGVALVWFTRTIPFEWKLAIFILINIIGTWATLQTSIETNLSDPQSVVIDEVLGYFLMFLFPFAVNPFTLIVAFIWFRIFDVIKPPPIRWFDRYGKKINKGHLSAFLVIWDDLLAGLYAASFLYLTIIVDKNYLHFFN